VRGKKFQSDEGCYFKDLKLTLKGKRAAVRAKRRIAEFKKILPELAQHADIGVAALGDSIIVETDLFAHQEQKPLLLNLSPLGKGFATWLKQELSRFPELGIGLSEPLLERYGEEDWGWGLWASRGKDRFWIALSYVGDRQQKTSAQWVISVMNEPGLNLAKRLFHKPDKQALGHLRDRVRQILQSNTAINVVKR